MTHRGSRVEGRGSRVEGRGSRVELIKVILIWQSRTTDGILNLLFDLGCCRADVIGSGIFQFSQAKFLFFSSRLLCSFLLLHTSR